MFRAQEFIQFIIWNIQKSFDANLGNNGAAVLKKNMFNSSTGFDCFHSISSFWTSLLLIVPPHSICNNEPTLIENGPVILDNMLITWKVYRQPERQTMDNSWLEKLNCTFGSGELKVSFTVVMNCVLWMPVGKCLYHIQITNIS